jgi:hypothetical protein
MFYRKKYPAKVTTNGVTFPLMDVVAASLIAYKLNGNKIEKYDVPAYTPEQGDTSRVATPRVVSNKGIIVDILKDPLRITQSDRDEAELVVQYCQGQVTMSILCNKKVSDFMKDMVAIFELPQVSASKFGMLVYAPNTYYTGKARDEVTEKTVELQYTSQPLGHVGDKVTFNFTLLKTGYIQSLDCYSVYGTDDAGNLVSFLTQHKHLCVSMKLSGKVKSAANDAWHNNAMVTSLNYVKAA